ncbi:uncharacterized protein EDB91DRAFT_1243916 [Suillus paluster]|uniref:uncharacterized protein n=1 Tax=Suillus paluster TaxID=48578 RepID=UPI001B86F723|nr:uncharacterized protein EDB91DRAFT_1243916 [Suillus paluster]KAG1750331.1 hypothetical protein EDB91DRAFT_1243916 [Suillus paluster]
MAMTYRSPAESQRQAGTYYRRGVLSPMYLTPSWFPLNSPTMDFVYSSSYELAWSNLCDAVEYSGIFDSEKRQPHSRCMENTCVALRESLRQVLDERDHKNVCLSGLATLAGVGKTSNAFSIAEEMKATSRLAATFFFSHKHAQQAAAIIPAIAYQLALTFPRIRGNIVKAIEKDKMSFYQTPYAIIIDALDESFSAEEAARLVLMLTETLAGPDLPIIYLIFTSRPEPHIRAVMRDCVHEILLTTDDEDTIRDVRFFLRASLDSTRTSHPVIFGQPPTPWPSEDYQQIIATSENPIAHCRILASIISWYRCRSQNSKISFTRIGRTLL